MRRRKISPLKLYLIERGLRQVDVAEAAGISDARFNRILNGRSLIGGSESKAIARAVNVAVEELSLDIH